MPSASRWTNGTRSLFESCFSRASARLKSIACDWFVNSKWQLCTGNWMESTSGPSNKNVNRSCSYLFVQHPTNGFLPRSDVFTPFPALCYAIDRRQLNGLCIYFSWQRACRGMKIDEVLMFAFEKSKGKLFEHAASLPSARAGRIDDRKYWTDVDVPENDDKVGISVNNSH